MKKLLLVVLLLAGVGILPASAQRHVKHLASWGAHLGRSETGNYYELSYMPMLTNHLALRLSGAMSTAPLLLAANTRCIRAGFCSRPSYSASGRWPTCICWWGLARATSGPTRTALGR